ncbi:MAG: hypothetical protein ACYDBR_11300, partial [Gaiellaceae bacterium]
MSMVATAARPFESVLRRTTPSGAAAGLLGLGAVAPIAAVDGGYNPSSWGWLSLALAVAAIVGIVVQPRRVQSRPALVAVGALAALAAWTLLSATWSGDAGRTAHSFELLLVYVSALAAAVVLVGERSFPALLTGVWAAATLVCGYSLLTRLYPDRLPTSTAVSGNRLAVPIGYWNSLGLLAAVGILVAVGLLGRRSRALTACAAASLVVLSLTLYFTFSRGGFLVLAAGLLTALALDRRRLTLLATLAAVAPWPVLAVLKASHTAALDSTTVPSTEAGAAGAGLARVALLLALAAALAAILLAEARRSPAFARAAASEAAPKRRTAPRRRAAV